VIRAALLGFGHLLPIVPGVILGLLANWLIGSWYFSRRVVNTEGRTLGWDRALKLTGLAVLMLGLTGTLLIGAVKMLS